MAMCFPLRIVSFLHVFIWQFNGTITARMGVDELHLLMSNQERIKMRIMRDKARKAEKRSAKVKKHGSFENVITMQNLHRSLKRRRQEVEWKGSVQRYIAHAIVKLKRTKDDLLKGKVSVNQSVRKRNIFERGKARDIHSIMIDARVIQGCLCDSSITPLTQPSLIYDNPASTKGKGVSHARRRNKAFIRKEIAKHKDKLYALCYDYTSYFRSIPHALCRKKLLKAGLDNRLTELVMFFIKMYRRQDITFVEDQEEQKILYELLEDDKLSGATLGSQISQDMALVIPNEVDHAVKDHERTKSYIRFMDDGISYGSKDKMRSLLNIIKQESEKLGLKLNEKKTHIVKMTHGITFLKIKYTVTKTGKIICRIVHESIVRMRRKLKKFYSMVNKGDMQLHDVFVAFKSWYGTVKTVASTFKQRKRMLKLYNKLFNGYGLKEMKIA